jgi:hypothetical protein
VFDAAGAFADTEWSALLSAVIRVERDVLTRSASTGLWRRSTETACYLSSAAITAARAASAIRDHWKIENTSHYSRDVTMGEDRSRKRAMQWAGAVVIHATGGLPEHYKAAVGVAVVQRRCLMIETGTAHVDAWLAATPPATPRMLFRPFDGGTHPQPVAREAMQ